MDEKTVSPLKIEPKFKNLIRPLQRKEYLQLGTEHPIRRLP